MQNEVTAVDVLESLKGVLHGYLQYQIKEFDQKIKTIAANTDVALNVLHTRDMPWEELNKQILKDHKFMLDEQNKARFDSVLDKFVVSCAKAKEALKTLDFVKEGLEK